MKLKLLIAPIIIIFAIWMGIAVVVPAYSEVNIQRDLLAQKTKQVEDIKEKSRNVEKLLSTLSASAAEQATLFKYLPDSGQEEDVINSLNDIAASSGVSVFNITVSKAKEIGVAQSAAPVTDATGGVAAIEAPAVGDVEVSYGIIGSYENVRNVFNKLAKLKRFDRITSIKITKPAAVDGAASGNLQVDMKLNFSYLEKVVSVVSVDNKIFSSGNFDLSVINEINSKTNTDVLKAVLDSAGKGNPFLP